MHITSISDVARAVQENKFNSTSAPEIFKNHGYYSVTLPNNIFREWTDIHEWCRLIFGDKHYIWYGRTFWFETAEDRTMFILHLEG